MCFVQGRWLNLFVGAVNASGSQKTVLNFGSQVLLPAGVRFSVVINEPLLGVKTGTFLTWELDHNISAV